jgi:hypothetical protein
MKKRFLIAFVALGIAAQFAVIGRAVWRHEAALRFGETLRFKTAPIDPHDAFRGRYVALRLDEFGKSFKMDSKPGFRKGQRIFLALGPSTNAPGFSAVTAITAAPPHGAPYAEAIFNWALDNGQSHTVYFDGLPATRYYMPEKLAPAAEAAYNAALRRGGATNAVAIVKARKGVVVVADVLVDGVPLAEIAKEKISR